MADRQCVQRRFSCPVHQFERPHLMIRHIFAYYVFRMSKPRAWVVQCNECRCIVTARAEDPQAHMQEPEPRPTCRLLVTCSCCWTSWLYPPEALFNGSPAPSPECFKRARQSARTENAKLIAAAVIAAIRLNRDEIKNSPVVHAKISDSLRLAEMIIARMNT